MLPFLIIAGLVTLAIAVPVLMRHRAASRRRRTLERMLDLADEVEVLLNRSQERMNAMRPLVERVPAEIAAEAQASLQGGLPIREAKRDVLQHRLWIQQHGGSASQAELDKAAAALARVIERLQGELAELETVGSDLASATDAAAEAARREPPTLRRPAP
jgi:hypothetical protein